MKTVIVRLSGPRDDGQLHGSVELVGTRTSVPFRDDGQLLALLREADQGPEPVLNRLGDAL